MNPFKPTVHRADKPQGAGPRPSDQPSPVENEAAHADPDQTSELIESLQAELAKARTERDELADQYKRSLADFQNYQRRALTNEQQAREQGTRGVVLNIIPIVDNFEMALSQDPAKTTAVQIAAGVTMIKDELVRMLQGQGVGVLNPAADAEFDPTRHEAIMHESAEGVRPGHVVKTLRLGYTLNDRVVRPAQVSVAPQASA